MAAVFAVLAIVSLILGVVLSMMIVHEVSKRGVKIKFFLIRFLIIRYINQYNRLTTQETGKVGPLYYPCIVSYQLALVFTVVYFVLR
jgi:hypothetical protein